MPKARSVPPQATVVDDYARLLSLAAHELRTPASVVTGYLRMLQKDTDAPLGERQRKMVDEAAKSCGRLVALIAEMSDIARLDSGHASPTAEAFDLFTELGDVASQTHEAADRDVELRLVGQAAGGRILGSRVRLAAAFGAVFRALMREQPTAVTMLCDRRLDLTSALVVVAREADIDRARTATPRPFDEWRGGVGLSLPMARRVIELTGGRIWSPTPDHDDDRGLRSAALISLPLL